MLIKVLETDKLGLSIMETTISHPYTSVRVKNFVEIKYNKRSAPSQPSKPVRAKTVITVENFLTTTL